MIGYEEALERLERAVVPLEPVELPFEQARGHALVTAVHADRDFPPTDRSAMDGFALRSADASSPGARLRVTGEIRAGRSAAGLHVGCGETLRIFTGAVLPPGADAVVMVERTHEDRDTATLTVADAVAPGDHVRRQGSELRAGEVVLEPGTVVRAAEVAALAALGATRVLVNRAPTVRVLSTGDEVIEADRVPEPHQVRNSNARALLAQLGECGLAGSYVGNAGDDRAELAVALATGLDADVLLVTGGVSVGAYDLVGAALEVAGLEPLFHGVAIKPGKPLLAGRAGRCLVFGLPGNPVSAFTGFALFVAPALRRMLGYRNYRNTTRAASLCAPFSARSGRVTFHLARSTGEGRTLRAARVATGGSGDVLSLARADGFLITPAAGGEFSAGSELPFLSFSPQIPH